jgi:UDP-N-acetylglucosamine/UDP-N-acetylgalactosamine diphosphorylase
MIMTSELNDKATRDFFAANKFFGLPEGAVDFFTQGTMPAIAYDGSLLLAAADSLALAPNGHGGTLLALKKSGLLAKLASEGVEHISYFQVDNPLVPVVDPLFIGLHSLEGAEISAIMLPKTNAKEKLGNFCLSKGRVQIIEYSDMPDELAEKRASDGSLAFIAGSPAIHVLSRAFVERLTKDGRLELPWHRADKKVAFLDESGKLVSPEKPNAVKLESFIFDALPLATKTVILEGRREDLFAPTKNPTGVDSVESCRAMLVDRDARRLELAGVKVPRKPDGSPDCVIEISPALVLDDEDAAKLLKNVKAPTPGGEAYYG